MRSVRGRLVVAVRVPSLLAVGVSTPLVAAAITWRALHLARFDGLAGHLVAGAALFALLVTLTFAPAAGDRPSPTALCRSVGMSAAMFVAIAEATRIPESALVSWFAAATFAAALSEEVVFRLLVPAWLTTTVGGTVPTGGWTRLAAIAASQLSFAAAHFIDRVPHATSAATTAFARLFVIGICYQVIAELAGLPAAIAAHATINLAFSLGRTMP